MGAGNFVHPRLYYLIESFVDPKKFKLTVSVTENDVQTMFPQLFFQRKEDLVKLQ